MKPELNSQFKQHPEISREDIKGVAKAFLDIAYSGQSPDQVLDLYLPEKGNAPYPLLIYIHSGGFATGSKSDTTINPMLQSLEKGFALASLDFRKSADVTWPAPIYDIKAAVRFLRANAAEYDIDPDKFAVWGSSSGAYLAAMLGITAGNPAFEDPDMGNTGTGSDVQAVINWSGCCGRFDELDGQIRANGGAKAIHNEYNSAESLFLGNMLTEIPELVRMASPCTYVHKDMPRFLIQHGVDDHVMPIQQSEQFAKAIIKSAGENKVKFIPYQGVGHYLNREDIVSAAYDFLEACIG